jgi:hypothetical protein
MVCPARGVVAGLRDVTPGTGDFALGTVDFGNVAGGLGTAEGVVADVALRLTPVEVVAPAAGAPRDMVLDGRGRWDIGVTAGFAFGDGGTFAGSFLAVVDVVDVDEGASGCRFAAVAVELVAAAGFAVAVEVELVVAGAFAIADVVEVAEAAGLTGVARGTEDGPSDGRGPGVLVSFLIGVGWAVPFVRVVDDDAGLACDVATAAPGRLVAASLGFGVSFVDAGLSVASTFSVVGACVGADVEDSTSGVMFEPICFDIGL